MEVGALLLYAFPGSPTIFYGDEAGMEGYEDPMNRGTFPWGNEDRELQRRYKLLGKLRSSRECLQRGELCWLYARGPVLAFARDWEGETAVAVMNVGEEAASLTLPWQLGLATDALTGQQFLAADGEITVLLPPVEGMLLV